MNDHLGVDAHELDDLAQGVPALDELVGGRGRRVLLGRDVLP